MGSGPFMIKSRTDDVVHLVPAPGVDAALRGVDLEVLADATASYDAFLDGQLDWTAVPPDRVEQVAERHGRTAFRPYLGQLFYGFNLKNPKYADVRFREAIVRAVDRDAIVRAIYGAAAQRLDGLVPDGVPGYVPDACGERCGFNPDRARALVAEIFGGQPAPEVAIDFDDTGTQRAVAEAMQANLQAVGIPATLRSHPFADYLRFAVSGAQEIFRLGWIGAYPTADGYLTPLFRSGLPDNVTGFVVRPGRRPAAGGPGPGGRVTTHGQLPAGGEAGAGATPRHPPGPVRVPLPGERPGGGPGDVGPGHLRRHEGAGGRVGSASTSEWRNRQTRQVEGLVPA